MLKKNVKMIFAIVIFLVTIFLPIMNVNIVYADNFDTSAFDKGNETVDGKVTAVVAIGINLIRIVGTAVAIIMLIFVAIKYMTAAPSEKADFKRSAGIYIFGAILLFAGTNILAIIADFTSKNI